MFDAAGAATAAPAVTDHAADPAAANHDAANHDAATAHADALATATVAGADRATAPVELRAVTPALNGGRKEVVFIESNVADYRTLVAGVKAGVEVVLLDSTKDGLSQMAQWAETHSGYDAIHVVSHGAEGRVDLGTLTLDIATTTTRAGDLARVGTALTQDGDLLLYGCDVATGVGQGFIESVARVTGADVAASTDPTGAASLGGNWTLERTVGTVEQSALSVSGYGGLLNLTGTSVYTLDNPLENFTNSVDNGPQATSVGDARAITTEVAFKTDLELESSMFLDVDVVNSTTSTFTIKFDGSNLPTYDAGGVFSASFTGGNLDALTSVTLVSGNEKGATASVSGKTFTFTIGPANTSWAAGDTIVYTITSTSLPYGNTPTVAGIAGTSPTYTEDGSAVALFSGAVADSQDSGQNFTGLKFTVSNVSDTTEYLRINGVDVALTNGTSQALGTNHGTASVSVSAGTATVTVSGMDIDNSAMSSLINGVAYKDSSQTPGTASTRTVTLSQVTDAGNKTATPNATSAVTVNPVADVTGVTIANGGKISNTTYGVGDHIDITVNFDQAVDVGGSPTLGLTVGSTGKTATYLSGSGSTALVFRYTVQAGDLDTDGIDVTANGISLTGGATITDKTGSGDGIADNAALTYTLVNNANSKVDGVAPNAPVVTGISGDTGSSSSDGITSDTTLFISGTAENNATVTVYRGATLLGTTTANGSGAWTYDYTGTTLSAGSYTFKATATDGAGNVSADSSNYSVVIDTAAPTGLALGTTTIGASSATAGAAVGTLSATDAQTITYSLATGSAGNDSGNGSFTIVGNEVRVGGSALTAGTYNIFVKATDAAGNESTQAFVITVVAAPSVSSINRANAEAVPAATTSVDFTVTFSQAVTGVDSSDFTLTTVTGTATGTIGTVSGSGTTWTVTVTGLTGDGTLRLDLKSSGTGIQDGSSTAISGGYSAGQTYTLDHTAPAAPVVTGISGDTGSSSSDGITSDTTLTISGTAENNATVTVYRGTTLLGTTTANGSGAWTYDYTGTTLSAGSYTFKATATDTAGNVSADSSDYAVLVDTTAPTSSVPASTVKTGTSVAAQSTETGTVYLIPTGSTVTDRASLEALVTGNTARKATVTNANTDTSIDTTGLTDGTYYVYSVDVAGNVSVQSTNAVTIDNTAPTASVTAATIKNTASVTTARSTEPGTVYLVPNGSTITDKASLEALVTGGTATKATVTTANTDTSLSAAGLADGTYKVYTVDAAGNVSVASTASITLDSTAPAASSTPVMDSASDLGPSNSDGVTSSTTPTIKGTAEPNATVTLYDTDGTTVLGSIAADGSGNWSITPGSALSQGTHTLTVKVTDAAGNVSVASSGLTVVIDTTAPVLTVTDATPFAYTENAAATAFATATTLAETNAPGRSVLTVQITTNNEAADSLSLATANGGGIWLDTTGNKVMSNGTQIGTADAAGVSNGTLWTITFLSTATSQNIQDTVAALRYANSSDNPGTSNRTVTVNLTDGAGNAATAATRTIAVTAVNDAPTNITLSASAVSTFDVGPATVGTVGAADPDNTTWTFSIVAVKDPSNATVANTNGALFDLGTTGSISSSAGVATATLRAVNPGSLSPGTYTITVQADDGGTNGTYQKDLTVTVSSDLTVTVLDIDGSAPSTYAADFLDGNGLDLNEALFYANNASGPVTIRFDSGLSGTITLGGTYIVRDGVTLGMDSSGNSRSLTITGNGFTLGGGFGASIATGDTLTINSTLADDGTVVSALSKSGAGTLVLGGTNNTATGGTTGTGLNTVSVTAGTLRIGSDDNLGTGTVTLNGGTLNLNSLSGTVDNDLTLGSSGGTVSLTNGTGATLSGTITGSGSLTKTGGPALTLSGTNSYSGGTTVSGTNGISVTDSSNLGSGTVTLNASSKLTVTGSSVTVGNAIVAAGGATIANANAVELSGLISGSGALTKTGAGALTLSYATGSGNTQSGGWTVSAGTLVASGGKAIDDSSAVTISGSGVFRVSGNETIGALTGDGSAGTDVTIDTGMTLTATYTSNETMAGVIGGLGGFTKAGTGTLQLEGNNSYTGATTVSAGTLVANGSGSALADTTAVTVESGATFVVWTGETVGSVSGAGAVSLNLGTLTLGGNGTSTEISGVISGDGNLAKTGSGTLTLSGTNTYTGTTTVSAGTLEVRNAAALGTAAGGDGTTVASGAVLTVQGGITLAEAFTLSGTGISSSGALVNVSGTNTLSGTVTLAANTTIGTTAGTLTLGGVVSGGTNTLTKVGTGTLTMTAVNTYTGLTTVSAGTLAGTATLGGGLTIASGATLAPGVAGTNNGIGTLTVNGNFTLNGALVAELAGASSYDQVIVSGTVTLNSVTSSVSVTRVNSYTAANGATFTLIDNTGGSGISSTFTGIAESTDTTTNGDIYTVSYVGGTGNDAVLTAVVNPTVSSVSATTTDGSYKAGDTISITVTFNRAVTVTGTPTLALGTGRTATYSSGSGGTTLTFTYTVQAGDTSADLDYASTGALTLNGGTIVDSSSSLAALLTLAAPGAANSLGANKAIVIDTTAPGAPTAPDMTAGTDSGSSSTDNVTSNTTPTFTGTAEPNSTVTLYDTDGTTVLGTGTTDGSGNYSVTPTTALTPGTHTLTVKARDAAGNVSSVSGGLSVTIDTSAPAAPGTPVLPAASDTGLSASDGITRTTTPTITGTAEPNSTVTLYDTDGTTVLGTGTADGSGNYSVTPTTALSSGPHTLTVKATDAAGNVSTASPGLSVTVDTTAPTVTGVTSSTADGSYKAGDTISIQVSLSEAVIVNGIPTITLSNGRTATYSGGSGTGTLTFTYTVQAGDTAADLDYASTGALALNGGTITDTAGNDAATTLPAVGGGSSLGGSKNIVIDTTAPTVSSVSVPTGGTYKAGDVMEFTVAFNEAVTVTGNPTLPITLDDGTVVQAAYVSGSGGTNLTFRYTVQAGLSDSDGVRLVSALSGGTITDLAGNAAVRTPGNVADTSGARIDSVAPTVTNVTSSTANGTYTTGETISIQVTFSEAVTVSGTPTLALNTGRTATYSGGSGSNTLTFTYTVQAGDTAADLDATGTGALAGSIADAVGNAGILTLTAPGDVRSLGLNKDIAIDTTPPSIRNVVVPNDGIYGVGKTLSFFVQASEVVIVNGTPTITLDIGGQTRQAVYNAAASTGSVLRFDYVVQAGDSDADGIAVTGLNLNGGSITDLARMPLPTTLAGLPGTQNVLVDTVAPDTPSVPALAAGQDTGVSATDGVTGITRPTLGGTAEAGSTVTVLVDGVAVGTTIAGTDGRWSFTPASPLAEGTHAVTSRATDPAGNSSGLSAALTLTIDATPPVLSTPAVAGGIDNTANVTAATRPTLTGTAEPNGTVTVLIDGIAVGTTAAGADGRWSFAVATPLAEGAHSVVTTATDRAGNTGRSGALSLTVDTQAPTLSTGGSTPTLSAGGTATLGSAVSLSDANALNRVTISLTDARSGDELVIGALPAGITATRDGSSIVLTGVASAADYQAAVRAIALRSSASDPSFAGTATSRSISIQARDLAGNGSAAATVTVAVARATTSPINTTNTPAITTPFTGSGNGPSLSGGSATGSSSNGPSSSGSSAPSLSSSGLPGGLGIGGFGPSLPGGGSSGSGGLSGSSSSTDAGRSVTLGSVGGSSSSTDAGRSVTLGSVGGNSSSTDAGRSVTLNSVGGGSSSSSGSGLGGSGLGGGLGNALGGVLGGSLGGGLAGNGLGGGLGGGPGAGIGTGGTPGAANPGNGTNTGTGAPGQTGTQGNGPNNGPNTGQGRGQGVGQERGNGPGAVQGRGPAAGQPGTQGQQGQGQQGPGEQGQGEQPGQPPQNQPNQGAPQDGGGTPADGTGQPAERGADSRAEIMPASPGFARQVARAHGGPADAAGLLAALASHVLPDSRAA
ncbi:hypothetical protein [Azospirillum endophyticum]